MLPCRIVMGLYSDAAELLQYIFPEFYKQRYFKNLAGISRKNILQKKIEPELLWLREFLPADAVVMDVGANVGAYVFIFESILKPKNIFAFEPNPKLFKRLKRVFPEINLFPIALSDEISMADFKIPVIGGKEIASRGTLQTSLKESGESSQKIEKVQVTKLDNWAVEQKITKIDFIKIDVEGNEMATLRGAEKTVEKFRPVMMVEMEQRHHETPLWNLIEEVKSWGFSANYLDRETFTLKNLDKEFLEKQDAANVKNYNSYINNIIFIPTK